MHYANSQLKMLLLTRLMSRTKLFRIFRLLVPLFFAIPFPFALMNCARESAPTGGPIDTIAPYVVFEKPKNNLQNSNPQKIVVKFNEYIALENIEDNCMIAPIMEERPDITVKKKKLIIDLRKQNLQPGTTYSFNFNNAIKDLTEKNMTEQYIYAFSTGVGIDSMKIAGSVSYAADGKIPEKAYVLLYDNLSDTAFKTQKPRYVTQITKKGEFAFSNIEAKPYRIYALEDSDKDFTFNQVSEKIAFLDTLFNPTAERYIDTVWFTHIDTIHIKNVNGADSLRFETVKDSFDLEEKTRWSDQNIKLQIFENEVWNQEILTTKRVSKFANAISLAAKNQFPTSITVIPNGSFTEERVDSDSLMIWFLDTTLQNNDTAKMVISYKKNPDDQQIINDTIMIEQAKDLPERLLVKSSVEKNNKVFPGDTVFITLSRPVATNTLNAIRLYESCDTTKMQCEEIKPLTDNNFRPKNFYSGQTILRYKEANDRFALYFSKPIKPDDVTVTLDGLPDIKDWYYCELDEKSNALLFWIKPEGDALRLKNQAITVEYPDEDGNRVKKNFNNKKDVPVHKMYKLPTSNKRLILHITDDQKSKLRPYEPIRIYCNNPISSITDSLFTLINTNDSTETSVITSISKVSPRILEITHTTENAQSYVLSLKRGAIIDTFGVASRELVADLQTEPANNLFVKQIPYSIVNVEGRKFAITADWQTNASYSLTIPDSTFADIFGDANDSTTYSFQCPKKEGLGNLLVKNTQGYPSDKLVFILQSADPKSNTTYTGTNRNDGIRFENVPAGNYTLHCFVDENQNKKWDTGCLEIKRQPEKKYFRTETITIKSEWENSVFWEEFETK